MNKKIYLFLIVLIFPALLMGQLKKDLVQPDFSNVLTQPTHPSSLFWAFFAFQGNL